MSVDELQRLRNRIGELENYPDGKSMEQTASSWRSRCLAAEHKNKELLAEMENLRRLYMESTQRAERA